MDFYKRLDACCKKRGITVTEMLKILKLSTGSGTAWKSGSLPKSDIMIKVSEYLDVSIDYLLTGRTHSGDIMSIGDVNGNNNAVGHGCTCTVAALDYLPEQEAELLRLYRSMSVVGQAQLLVAASDFAEKYLK